MAYDEPPTINAPGTDTQVLIRAVSDATDAPIVVAFRGTSNLRDYITDGEVWRTNMNCGAVHQGFWAAWTNVQPQVLAWLQLYASRTIFVTGHSLGGALAQLCARDLDQRLFSVQGVYTFGCPRVGDNKFEFTYNQALGNRTFNVINDCDIVVRIPGWLAGFRRPGHDEFISAVSPTLIVEDPKTSFRLESDVWSLIDAFRARRNPLVLDELITDHHVNCYIKALDGVESVSITQ